MQSTHKIAGSCHTVPGIVGAHGKIGPGLEGVATHSYIAGQLPNQPLNASDGFSTRIRFTPTA
jgi:hypothetical protein